jgi:hypothetical protein
VEHWHDDSGWVAFSKELNISFHTPISPSLMFERMNDVLIGLGRALKEEGCPLIGHIKVLIRSEADEHLFLSLTSFDQIPASKGKMEKEVSKIMLTINAIVYGFNKDRLDFLVGHMIEERFKRHVDQLSC